MFVVGFIVLNIVAQAFCAEMMGFEEEGSEIELGIRNMESMVG
jgi:hypothetical protein